MGGGSHNKIEDFSTKTSHSSLSSMEPNVSNTNNNNMHSSHCSLDIAVEVHRVVPPPHRSFLHKLKNRLKETFFPDDPLRQFKGQSPKQKWILGAQYVFPILQWGPNYSLKLFKSDIVSGLTIASLAIPQVHLLSQSLNTLYVIQKVQIFLPFLTCSLQGISYAQLANLPPIVGLCEWICFTIFFLVFLLFQFTVWLEFHFYFYFLMNM